MYKNILVPILIGDEHDTKASFDVARALADEGASFTVLHVMETIPSYVASQLPDDVMDQSWAEAEQAVKDAAADLEGASARLISGHAGRTIVDYAGEQSVDCIIIASHRPGFEDYFLGSTAARVVRHSQCAVHVIR